MIKQLYLYQAFGLQILMRNTYHKTALLKCRWQYASLASFALLLSAQHTLCSFLNTPVNCKNYFNVTLMGPGLSNGHLKLPCKGRELSS